MFTRKPTTQNETYEVEKTDEGKNPHYDVRFDDTDQPQACFSKVYSDPPNPTEDFCAVMTCSQADKNCPLVHGCSLRVAIPFEDPKVADDTPEEAKKYEVDEDQLEAYKEYVIAQANKQ